MAKELLTVRCPDDLAQLIQEQIEVTGRDRTTVVISMLRQSFPCVSFKERNKLPSIPAIYLVFSSNNLLYIGRSNNLKQRWQTHHRHHQFKLIEGLQIAWFECYPDNLPAVESTLIDLLDPEYNGTYNEWSNEKSQVISYRLEDELIEKLKEKALPSETVHQTAQRLMREALGTSPPLVEVASASTTDLDERIESILEERLSAFANNQNDLLSRLQERIQEVEAQVKKLPVSNLDVDRLQTDVDRLQKERDQLDARNLELEAAEGDLKNDLSTKDEEIAQLTEELGKIKAIAPQPTTSHQESLTQGELAKRLNCDSGTLTKNRKKPNFDEWSRSKDPEGKTWKYLPDTQRYSLVQAQKSSWEARVEAVVGQL